MTTTGGKWSWITVTCDGRSSWLLQVVNIGGTKDDVRDVVRTFSSTVCSLQHDHKKTKTWCYASSMHYTVHTLCIVLPYPGLVTLHLGDANFQDSRIGNRSFRDSRFGTNFTAVKLHVLFQNSLRVNNKNIFGEFSSFFKQRSWDYLYLDWANLYRKAL